MRLAFAVMMSVLLFGGFITHKSGNARGGGTAASTRGERSREVAAPPAEIMAGVRESLSAEGYELVSLADNGDHYRQVITSGEFAADPEMQQAARLGDMINTARVGIDEVVVSSRFTQVATSVGYRISVLPGEDGKSSRVTLEPRIEQGSGRAEARIAARLREAMDRQSDVILDRIASPSRG